MPQLKRIGDITYDQDNESIAIVSLAYFVREKTTDANGKPAEKDVTCDHEGNTTIDANKLAEHLSKSIAPDVNEKITYFFHRVLLQDCAASPTGTMTLKIERKDHQKVVLKDATGSNNLNFYIDLYIDMSNKKLARQAEEKLEAAKAAPAGTAASSTGLFSPAAAKALHTEIAEAVAKAQQTPRAKL